MQLTLVVVLLQYIDLGTYTRQGIQSMGALQACGYNQGACYTLHGMLTLS